MAHKSMLRYPFSFAQKLRERRFCTQPSCGRVLMFHRVCDDRAVWRDGDTSITLSSFKRLIQDLSAAGSRFLPIDQAVESADERNLFITFDDAFCEVYETVFPLLNAMGVPFAAFVATGYLEEKDYLSRTMLKTLAASPLFTLGAHTASHPMLRYLENSKAKEEICAPKAILEDLTGVPVCSFAYPYGSVFACSGRDRRYVREAGYAYAFSTINSPLNALSAADRFFLPRMNVNEQTCDAIAGGGRS